MSPPETCADDDAEVDPDGKADETEGCVALDVAAAAGCDEGDAASVEAGLCSESARARLLHGPIAVKTGVVFNKHRLRVTLFSNSLADHRQLGRQRFSFLFFSSLLSRK